MKFIKILEYSQLVVKYAAKMGGHAILWNGTQKFAGFALLKVLWKDCPRMVLKEN